MSCEQIKGSNLIFKMREEVEYGLQNTDNFTEIPVSSVGYAATINEIESEIISGGRAASKKLKGNTELSGSFSMALDAEKSYLPLKNVFGKVSSASVGSKYAHTFEISDTCRGSLQAEKKFNGTPLSYIGTGLSISDISIEVNGEGEAMMECSILGKNEILSTVKRDYSEFELSADAAVNSQTLSFLDVTGIKVGDYILGEVYKGALSEDVKKGSRVISLGVGEGANFNVADRILLGKSTYLVKLVSGDKLILVSSLEEDYLSGLDVQLIENTYKVTAINGLDVTIDTGLKNSYLAGDFFYGDSIDADLVQKKFNKSSSKISSGSESVIGYATPGSTFNFSNNSEIQRFQKDAGEAGSINDGKNSTTLDFELAFTADVAKFVDEAKAGKEFDMNIYFEDDEGNTLEFIMPKGTISITSPAVETAVGMTVSLSYSSFDGITAVLTNDVASY